MDVCGTVQPARRVARDPTACCSYGRRESGVGLHPDPRRAEERRPSRGPLDHPVRRTVESRFATMLYGVVCEGHTDPFFVLPYGVSAEIDCDARRFLIVESAVV